MAAIEFAMLSPVFFVLIFEIFQYGLYLYITANVAGAATAASRQILTGSIGNQNLNKDQFRTTIVCPQLGGLACVDSIIVHLINLPAAPDATGYVSLVNSSGTGLKSPPMSNAQTSFCPGFSGGIDPSTGRAGVEVLEIFYPMPVISLFWQSVSTRVNGQNVYYVRAISTFQNEPYPVITQTGGC